MELHFDSKDFHTFGYPVCVLDSILQSGMSAFPKQDPRAKMGIYVGPSPCHASNVALVLNSRTGHISPQLHVIFDENFTKVPYLMTSTVPTKWETLVSQSSELVIDEPFVTTKN